MDLSKLPEKAKKAEAENKKFFQKVKKLSDEKVDKIAHELHDEVFEEIDCLSCANCCKTTSPAMYERDVERLAKFLKIRPSELIEKYLELDDDKEYVFKSAPCPFLAEDNYCHVYEARPTACREYPHTNRKRFRQILDLTLKNTFICPAAYEVVEKMKRLTKYDF
ncbi:MAG: YkgJ family cysteine cluster protein [Cytophagaceae bacterium]